MAIFITGDTHGDFTRLKKNIFYEQAELTKEDCVLITGDFGGVWDGGAEKRQDHNDRDLHPPSRPFLR